MIGNEELAMRILATLEEAGSERLVPLLNTIMQGSGNVEEVAGFQQALRRLLASGHVELFLNSMPFGDQRLSDDQAANEIDALAANYRFHDDDKIWRDARFSGPPFYQTPEPAVALTGPGRQKSEAVLERRGPEWWR